MYLGTAATVRRTRVTGQRPDYDVGGISTVEFRFLCYRPSLLPPLPDKHELFGVTPVTDGSENRSLSVASEKLASDKSMRARRDRRAKAAQ